MMVAAAKYLMHNNCLTKILKKIMVNTILNKRPDSSSENSGYKINAENKKKTPKQDNLYF